MDEVNLARLRRRGVSKGSITRLSSRVRDLESTERSQDTVDTAQWYKEQLIATDAEFRAHHYSIVDVLEDPDLLAAEQATLDEHDDAVSQLTTKLQKILRSNAPVTGVSTRDTIKKAHPLGKGS